MEIRKLLASHGYRSTKARQKVFDLLNHTPQSVADILKKLQAENSDVDKVTIYRTLSSFVKLNLVEETKFKDGVSLYELADSKHHHHVLCEKCGKIEDICIDENLLVKTVKNLSSFKIKSHHLEFFGLCKKCQK